MKGISLILFILLLCSISLLAGDVCLSNHGWKNDPGLDVSTCLPGCYTQVDMPPEILPPLGKGPLFRNRKQLEKERKHIERFRLLKLLELLELEEDKEIEFMVTFRKYRKEQRKLNREKNRTIEKLADGLRFNLITEKEIKRKIEKIDRLDMAIREHNHQFYNRVKTILNPKQLGKLYVFEARFELEVLGQMAEFRRRGDKMLLKKKIEDNPRHELMKKDSFK